MEKVVVYVVLKNGICDERLVYDINRDYFKGFKIEKVCIGSEVEEVVKFRKEEFDKRKEYDENFDLKN